jgi:membrane-associated phospholipid phosphatase
MDVPHKRLPQVGRLREAGFRLRLWWPAKLLGITVGMTAFFTAYFRLLQHPLYPVTIMPLTAVDRLIGFWPESLPLYFSLWFYVSLAPALMIDRRELVSYALAAVGISVVGLATFLFWPTAVPPLEADWSRHPGFAFLKSVDATGNACPSLHAAFAVFTAVSFDRLLGEMDMGRPFRALNGLWCTGILYSTLATRQHVSLDVLVGAALGATVAGAHLHWLRTHQRQGKRT